MAGAFYPSSKRQDYLNTNTHPTSSTKRIKKSDSSKTCFPFKSVWLYVSASLSLSSLRPSCKISKPAFNTAFNTHLKVQKGWQPLTFPPGYHCQTLMLECRIGATGLWLKGQKNAFLSHVLTLAFQNQSCFLNINFLKEFLYDYYLTCGQILISPVSLLRPFPH